MILTKCSVKGPPGPEMCPYTSILPRPSFKNWRSRLAPQPWVNGPRFEAWRVPLALSNRGIPIPVRLILISDLDINLLWGDLSQGVPHVIPLFRETLMAPPPRWLWCAR